MWETNIYRLVQKKLAPSTRIMLTLYMLTAHLLLRCVIGMRQSPQLSTDIASSLRSAIVLPAARLVRKLPTSCDSMTTGPFCGLVNDLPKVTSTGVFDRNFWGNMSNEIYQKLYLKLSDYAQNHWVGSPQPQKRGSVVSVLSTAGETFSFNPFLAAESVSWSKSSNTSIYILNSFFGYISFVHHAVSITEFKISAPVSSSVLVRAYRDGLPVWSRGVSSGTQADVSRASRSVDPSIESVDYIEVIGEGAELISMSVSFDPNNLASHKTYLYMDADIARPSRYAGINQFPPSAHLVDMETVIRENLVWRTDAKDLIPDATEFPAFKHERLLELIPSMPISVEKYLEFFTRALSDFGSNGRRESRPFEELHVDVLLDSAPELLAAILAVQVGGSPSAAMEKHVHALKVAEAKLEGKPVPVFVPPAIEAVPESTDADLRLNLQSSVAEVNKTAEIVLETLQQYLGTTKLRAIVLRAKLERIVNSKPVPEGIDEQVLLGALREGLDLPITKETPFPMRLEIFNKILPIMAEGAPEGAAELAVILAHATDS